MDVYIVRHAIAEKRDPERWPDDAKRPLIRDGVGRFRSAARGLRQIVPEVDVVLASPYTRAWQTAEILRDEAGWPPPEHCPALEAVNPANAALDVLQSHRERSTVALVGHEPYLSSLASLLISGDERALRLELKKGAVALLAFVAEPAPGAAVLRWSVSPKILRELDPESPGATTQ